ncbi:MAG: hypothetical protein D6696_07600 [Acidobacteria bacterium]|nr:MAG: hypothetical protein D6696_07600 [Acidobacteriota bacterium]
MNRDPQAAPTAELYIDALGGGDVHRRALLACAAPLRLDDETACAAVELVAGTNGTSAALVRRIKDLGCVGRQWDGTWYLADEVRGYLVERLRQEVSPEVHDRLRSLLAERARRQLGTAESDGQLGRWRARAARIEAAYQTSLIGERGAEGARAFVDAWRREAPPGRAATAEAVDHLAPEIERHAGGLAVEIAFFQGIAAYRRGSKNVARQKFEAVWRQGKAGEIYAIAAHLYGRLTRDRKKAEKAYRDSIAWYADPFHQAQVYHSLGQLLAEDRRRWNEAENALRKSLELLTRPADQAQVYHSLGLLLAKDQGRWNEAEDALRKSLELLTRPADQAQVYHSLGLLLAKNRRRWNEAEDALRKSLELLTRPADQAQVLASWANAILKLKLEAQYPQAEEHARRSLELGGESLKQRSISHKILAELYERQGRITEAIRSLEAQLDADRKMRRWRDVQRVEEALARLRRGAYPPPRAEASYVAEPGRPYDPDDELRRKVEKLRRKFRGEGRGPRGGRG